MPSGELKSVPISEVMAATQNGWAELGLIIEALIEAYLLLLRKQILALTTLNTLDVPNPQATAALLQLLRATLEGKILTENEFIGDPNLKVMVEGELPGTSVEHWAKKTFQQLEILGTEFQLPGLAVILEIMKNHPKNGQTNISDADLEAILTGQKEAFEVSDLENDAMDKELLKKIKNWLKSQSIYTTLEGEKVIIRTAIGAIISAASTKEATKFLGNSMRLSKKNRLRLVDLVLTDQIALHDHRLSFIKIEDVPPVLFHLHKLGRLNTSLLSQD